MIDRESKTAEVLNEFFSKIVKVLKIPEYENLNSNFENMKGPVFEAILKPPEYHCDKRKINFPNFLKLAYITPLHKKGRKGSKENYRPVFKQMSVCFDKFLLNQQCRFQNGSSTHEFIRKMEELS